MTYTTPGVFVEEISTFPPTVVPLATAVPAFVGYTERATDAEGNSLNLQPTRITSMLDFELLFGGAFQPASYRVQLDTANANAIGEVIPRDATDAERRYYLYPALRHYFANGGGPCYIVSVGIFPAAVAIGTATTEMLGGVEALRGFDAPTLIVAPDAVNLSDANLGSLQVSALNQCRDLQDRFTIMDLRTGRTPPAIGSDPADTFRNNVGSENLRYGAAYYPWLRSTYRPDIAFAELAFVDMANAAIADTTIDGLMGPDENALVANVRAADTRRAAVVSAVNTGSGMTITADNLASTAENFQSLVTAIRNASATTLTVIRPLMSDLASTLRAYALSLEALRPAPVTGADDITGAVESLLGDTVLQAAIDGLIAWEKHADVRNLIANSRSEANVDTDYAAFDGQAWISTPTVNGIAADTTVIPGADNQAQALAATDLVRPHFDVIAAAVVSVWEAAEFMADTAQTLLFAGHPVIAAARDKVQTEMSIIPPSGAVTGVYAAVDRVKGVWNAPANTTINDVIGPAVKVGDPEQGRLNVHTTGKSVNVIRAFTGRGTRVWGARTLAGNDNEWRYVNVRRFFNMAEESIKKGTEPFTFEPNVAATWVRAKSMIENFLTIQWRQGALMGGTPAQAFTVQVGLGTTMTPQDILEGRMIIEVGMAVVRPAEFIILKFSHKMQES